MGNILVVDDEKNMRELIADVLARDGHNITGVGSGESALEVASKERFDLVVLDLKLPGIDGIETMYQLRRSPDASLPDIIIITAHATVDTAIEALRGGAIDFLIKPFEPGALRDVVRRAGSEYLAFDRAAKAVPILDPKDFGIPDDMGFIKDEDADPPLGFIGRSKELKELFRSVQQVAGTDATVLIMGETGVGKELVARALHMASLRRDNPFVSINCAALPDTLVENELFGHERGAFTDARTRQMGKVAQAQGGTLFLDEVGDLAPPAQAKLLRLIEEREFTPLGGTEPIKADARIVAATHRDLSQMVEGGSFREDLYWRLRVIPIRIPPLRERGSIDIRDLTKHFMEEFAKKYNRPIRSFSEQEWRALYLYGWPGNVRELRNYVERFLLIGDASLPRKHPSPKPGVYPIESEAPPPPPSIIPEVHEKPLDAVRRIAQQIERDAIIDAINKAGGNKKLAARSLGMSYRTMFNKIKRYRIDTEIIAK